MSQATPLSWPELIRRTWRETIDDDVLGLAAQLSYYFFLALFPAVLFLLALASFFPLSNLTDDLGRSLGPFVSAPVLELIQDQMRRLANNESGGLLTFGVLGALWSSSAALVSIVGALNRAYDIEEGRPWWKVRLVAIGLTIGAAGVVLIALSLVLAGPTFAKSLGMSTGWGAAFEWSWLILQWPLVFALVATAVGLVYYFGPDADQDWRWISPGAVGATALWLVVSLLFKAYIANFTNYNDAYGAVGGVIVLLLWFYVSGVAILVGAELNAEIEHASVYGKPPGQKNPAGKRLLGRRAERAFQHRQRTEPSPLRLPNVLPPLRDVSAVLFDVDGTLVESNRAHAETWAQALSEHGFNGDATRIRPLIGMGGDKLLPAIAGIHEDSREGRAVVQRKKELFAQRLAELEPSRGARSLVDHLRRLNKTVIVATSADDREMAAVLERAGVADLIPRRTSKDDAARSKPDPDIVNAALRQSGAQSDKAIMIGDTPYDIEAARRAGIAAIALRCGGHWSDRDLQGAIAIFDDPAALLDHWR